MQEIYIVRKNMEIVFTASYFEKAVDFIDTSMESEGKSPIPATILEKNKLEKVGDTLIWRDYSIVLDDLNFTSKGEYQPVKDPTNKPWWRDWDHKKECCIASIVTDAIGEGSVEGCCFVTEVMSSADGCCAVSSSMDGMGDCCAGSASFDGASCYIATSSLDINPEDFRQTEVYKHHPDLVALRKFRDTILAHSFLGRVFAKSYYLFGRYPARFIRNKPRLKWFTRHLIVKPLARVARTLCR